MTSQTSKTRKTPLSLLLLVNFLLLFFSFAVALFIGEIGVRYYVQAWPFEPELHISPELKPEDEVLRWRMSSGVPGLNSLGLRNREILEKASDTFRILFLGDSMVFSGRTSSGKLYTEVIESNLSQHEVEPGLNHTLENKNVEVINSGIPGYTTYQELEFLRLYGLDMKPDLVILGFVFNDLYFKYLHRPTKDNALAMDAEARLHQFDTDRFPLSLFSRSYLAHQLFSSVDIMFKKYTRERYYEFERREGFYLAWKSHGWKNSDRLIGEIQQLLSEREIPLLIAIFPISDQMDETYLSLDRDYVLYPQSRIEEIAQRRGIPYKDLTEKLYQGGGRELFIDYLHLGDKGNDIVAAELTTFLNENLL